MKKYFLQDGIAPRYLKSEGHKKTAQTLNDVQHVVQFILNYADIHGLVLPGQVLGFARDDIKILPGSITKKALWKVYNDYEVMLPVQKVKETTFRSF